MLSKGDDGIQRLTLSDPFMLSKGDDGMPRPTSSNRVIVLRAMMTCQARHRLTVYVFQWRIWHVMTDVVLLCMLSKGDYSMPDSTSFDCVCCPRAMRACNALRGPIMCDVQGL